MAEIKVITVQAGEDFLAALTKLLGSDVAAAVKAGVEQAGVKVDGGNVAVEETDEEPERFDEEIDEEIDEEECSCCCCSGDCSNDDDLDFPAEPEFEAEFGAVDGDEETDEFFQRTYKVEAASDLKVVVTKQGVVVSGSSDDRQDIFSNTYAPLGAYDEVTAYFNENDETLSVTLWKVPEEGTEVEIEGF